jgi:3-deoxy-D-manno-octulosonate 8-phosphate phosphatase (KDO 8-P phosphatase)
MKKIKYIFLDVDGTLTDGKILIDSQGNESKAFSVKDGEPIKKLSNFGVKVIVVTGRISNIVVQRCSELNIKFIHQGINNKEDIVKSYLLENQNRFATLYIGDDLNDLAAMKQCTYKACPKDAAIEVINECNYVSILNGGSGAVRDIINFYDKKEMIDYDIF